MGRITNDDDAYVAANPTTLTFTPSETTKTVTVTGNTVKEANETFQVRLTSPVGQASPTAQAWGVSPTTTEEEKWLT